MPAFKFNGFMPTFINGLRDVEGYQLGWIKPGDVIDAPEAPNSLFSPVDAGADATAGSEPNAPAAIDSSTPVAPATAPEVAPQPTAAPPANPAATAVVH